MSKDTAYNFIIEQRGSQWCLLTSDKSRVLGCHDSREEADAQEAAMKSSQADHAEEETVDIKNVTVFKTGTYNGETYTEADLDAMMEAYGRVGYTPPIKRGHKDEPGAPALGWAENLRKVGTSLIADLTAIPKSIRDAIKARRYDYLSPEVYINLKRNGQTFPKALKAIALLGADIPAVPQSPLHSYLSQVMMSAQFDAIRTYELGKMEINQTDESMSQKNGGQNMADEKDKIIEQLKAQNAELEKKITQATDGTKQFAQIEADLKASRERIATMESDRRTEKIAAKVAEVKIPALRSFAHVFYALAMCPCGTGQKTVKFSMDGKDQEASPEAAVDAWVKTTNAHAERLFREFSVDIKTEAGNLDEPVDKTIDRKVREFCVFQKIDPIKDYATALKSVLDANPDLKKAYAQS